jgi:hypothetical protein
MLRRCRRGRLQRRTGLDVAVAHAHAVAVLERVEQLLKVRPRLLWRHAEGRVARDEVVQVAALGKVEHHEDLGLADEHLVAANHVRVVQMLAHAHLKGCKRSTVGDATAHALQHSSANACAPRVGRTRSA